jgi:hypothetical protein
MIIIGDDRHLLLLLLCTNDDARVRRKTPRCLSMEEVYMHYIIIMTMEGISRVIIGDDLQ